MRKRGGEIIPNDPTRNKEGKQSDDLECNGVAASLHWNKHLDSRYALLDVTQIKRLQSVQEQMQSAMVTISMMSCSLKR